MSDDIYDKHAARIAVSIYKALCRPEILKYMRKQLVKNIVNNINTLTDEEIDAYINEVKVLLDEEKTT